MQEIWNAEPLMQRRRSFQQGELPEACQGQLCLVALDKSLSRDVKKRRDLLVAKQERERCLPVVGQLSRRFLEVVGALSKKMGVHIKKLNSDWGSFSERKSH
jgi:hypothetical protein